MFKKYSEKALKAALPLILGYVGGTVSLLWPHYFAAFCTGAL